MIVFKSGQMQKLWDACNKDLPESLWQNIFTAYMDDYTEPNGSLWNMLIGYSLALKDSGLPLNPAVEKMIVQMCRKEIANY